MGVKPDDLRTAMRRWTTGVTIVSAADGEIRHGMTVSTFTSVSLEPPLVLVSLERVARTHALVERTGAFGVVILSLDQQDISDRFAGRQTEDTDRFIGLATQTLITGAPLLADHLACFDCRVHTSFVVGTHTIFIGEVVAFDINEEPPPLVYFDRAYRKLQT